MAVRKEMLVSFVIFALQTGTQNFSIALLFPCTFLLNAESLEEDVRAKQVHYKRQAVKI